MKYRKKIKIKTCKVVSQLILKCWISFQRVGNLVMLWRFVSARHFIWLWVLCNLRQHDWCSTFMRGILTAPLQCSMRTQLCVWAGNLEFMSPWQQNPWSCIMDYHWNSTPLPNIMRTRDLIKSAHSVWHKVKKELSLYWGRGWEKQPARQAVGETGRRVADWAVMAPAAAGLAAW